MSQTSNLHNPGNLNYLFSSRLNFLEFSDDLILHIKSVINEDAFNEKKINLSSSCQKVIKSLKDIEETYELFYSLIYHCRFDKKNLE